MKTLIGIFDAKTNTAEEIYQKVKRVMENNYGLLESTVIESNQIWLKVIENPIL